jgi:hypothetical protein
MYSLAGRENANDGGCLFVMGGLLFLTIVSLIPILFPDASSAPWYGLVASTTDILLFLSLFLFIVPFSDSGAKHLLLFILLSCILLQITLYQTAFNWPNVPFLPADWSVRLRAGYASFLVGLFIFTIISHYLKDSRTRKNINESSIAVSEQRITIGEPFTIRYTLSSKQTIPIESISVTFVYHQYVNHHQQPYEERNIPIYQRKNCISEPTNPLVETFSWTIPTHLLPEDGTRKGWSLNVQLDLLNGITIHTIHPLKVIWAWPDKP